MLKKNQSACKSLEEEICQIAILISFLQFIYTHLGFSGDCQNYRYVGGYHFVCAQLFDLGNKMQVSKRLLGRLKQMRAPCDKLTRDGHLLGELAQSAVTAL